MPDTTTEQRVRNFLFTVTVGGAASEHKVITLSGLQEVIAPIEAAESHRKEKFRIAGHATVDNFTIREAPIMGCLDESVGNFLFDLDIQGVGVVHLRRVSGLGVQWATIENKESDQLAIQKLFGHQTYPDITVEAVMDAETKNQFKQYVDKVAKFTGPGPQFAHAEGTCPYVQDMKLRALAHDKSVRATWDIRRAWVLNWAPFGDLDAGADDLSIEKMTLALDPLPNSMGIIENIITPFDQEHMGSSDWYSFVASAWDIPEKKNLVINIYAPGKIPRRDEPVASYKVFNTWVSQVSYSDFDASSDDLLTREVTITAEGVIPL